MPRKRAFVFLLKMYVYLYCLLYQEQYLDHLLLASSGRQVEGRESLPVKQAWHIRHTLLNGSYLDWSMWSTQSALRDDSAGKQIYFSFFLYLKKKTLSSPGLFRYFSLVLLEGFPLCPDLSHGERSRIRTRSIPQPQQSDALRMSHHISTSHDISVID